jgi:hypothetical protein
MSWASPTAHRIRATAWCIAACAILTAGIGAATARAAEGPYSIAVRALTGPQGTTLTIELTQAESASPVTTLEQVNVRMPAAPPRMDVRILKDVPLQDGVATIELKQLERGTPVSVQALVKASRTYVLDSDTTAAFASRSRRRGRAGAPADADHAPDRRSGRRRRAERRHGGNRDGVAALGPVGARDEVRHDPDRLARRRHVPRRRAHRCPAGGALGARERRRTRRDRRDERLSHRNRRRHGERARDVAPRALVVGRLRRAVLNHLYAPITPTPPTGFADLETR